MQVFRVAVCLCWLVQEAATDEVGQVTVPADFQNKVRGDDESDLNRWIQKLGSATYRDRQEAFLHLWSLGQTGSPQLGRLLDQASDSEDLDLAISCRWLKMLIRLASSPAEVSPLLKDLMLVRSGDSNTLLRLASNQKWEHLETMLEILDPRERARISSELGIADENLVRLLFLAWETQQQSRIPKIVDLVWPESQSIKSRLLWRDLDLLEPLHLTVENAKPIRESVDNAKSRANLARIVDLELNDRHTDAIEFAIGISDYHEAFSMATEHANWPLAIQANDLRNKRQSQRASRIFGTEDLHEPSVPEIPTPASIQSGVAAVEIARRSVLSSWAGDEEKSLQLAKAIGQPGPSELDVAGLLTALPFCGRLEDAISVAKLRDEKQAFETLVAQGRITEAVESLGWKDWTPASVRAWLDDQLKKSTSSAKDNIEQTLHLARVGCLMNRLGERELDEIINNAFLQWVSGAGAEHESKMENRQDRELSEIAMERWRGAIYVWVGQHRRDWANFQFQQLLREGIEDKHRNAILQQLYVKKTEIADLNGLAGSILEWFRDERVEQAKRRSDARGATNEVDLAWVQAAQDLENLAHGREVLGWPEDWHRFGLVKLGEGLIHRAEHESRANVASQLARLALEINRSDLAKIWLFVDPPEQFLEIVTLIEKDSEELPRLDAASSFRGNDLVDRLEILTEIFKHRFEYKSAARLLEFIVSLQPGRIELALECARCLDEIGETNRAQQIRSHTLSIPLSSEQAQQLASELEERKFLPEAMLLLRHSLRIHDRNSSNNWLACANLASEGQEQLTEWLTQGNPEMGAKSSFLKQNELDNRRVWLSRLDAFPERSFDLKYSIHAIEAFWRARARIAILEGKPEDAENAIQQCIKANPDQIETPIELIPLAEKTFGKAKVEEWLDRYTAPMESHMSRWKHDTLVGNNLAWLYANVDRRLERARELSTHVVELLPNDHVYLDTLAEVEFRLGNRARAIEVSARCRDLAPLEQHHRNQIERFRGRMKPD
jgi:tetratricopeptide (TPR) repeat protein